MNDCEIAFPLLGWFAEHARELPWRGNADPYAVWVSEIMLQQTRVETVMPYYLRWMERFPTIAALARAEQEDVLLVWEGLGYYSRARNLHRAASIVVAEYSGKLPASVTELRKLPGIGRYTAGAIASIAFGQNEPALDGNTRRVLARLFNVTQPLGSSLAERRLWALAEGCLPEGRAGAFNQALMDLGAMVCTPHSPGCGECPLEELCQARAMGVQEQRPVKPAKTPVPHYDLAAAVIGFQERVLITRRQQDSLLGGMWEFPGVKQQPGEDLVSCLQREIKEELAVDVEVCDLLDVYRHAYTHYKVTVHVFICSLRNGNGQAAARAEHVRWVNAAELGEYPMGKIDRLIANRLQQEVLAC